MREARRRGQVVGKVPYGFRLVGNGSKYIEEDEHEQTILVELRWRRAEGYSFGTIADMFNERGWRNRSGRPWRRQLLEQLIQRHGNGGLT